MASVKSILAPFKQVVSSKYWQAESSFLHVPQFYIEGKSAKCQCRQPHIRMHNADTTAAESDLELPHSAKNCTENGLKEKPASAHK